MNEAKLNEIQRMANNVLDLAQEEIRSQGKAFGQTNDRVCYNDNKKDFKQIAPLIRSISGLLEACWTVLNEWHGNDDNYLKMEPKYLESIRKIIKIAEEANE